MSTPVVAGLVVVGIAVWWYGEYRNRGDASRWPPLKGLWLLPAAVFRAAVRAMWANRWLALCLLLISWLSLVERNVALARLMAEFRRGRPSAMGVGAPGGSLLDFGGSVLRDPGWVRQLLPRISEDLCGVSYGPLVGAALLVAFAVAMLGLICRPPACLPDSGKQAAVWPMLVSLLGAAVFAIQLVAPQPSFGTAVPGSIFLHSAPAGFAISLLMPFALGPVSAALLSLLHQAVTEGVARMSPALQAAVRAWPQVGAMWLLLTWPTALLLISAGAPRGGAWASPIDPITMVWALQAVWQWAVVLVAFLPWVLLESNLQFWPAVVRSIELVDHQGGRLIALLPGYAIVMVPAWVLAGYAGAIARVSTLAWHPGHLAQPLLSVFSSFCMVAIYLQLRDADAARGYAAVAEADDEGADVRPGEAAGDIQT